MSKWKILYNPFEKYSERSLIVFGVLALGVGSVLAYLTGARFDNFLHMGFVDSVTWWQPVVDNLINLGVLILILFIFGRILNSKTRAVDIIATALIGQSPFYWVSLTNIDNRTVEATNALLEIEPNGVDQLPISETIYLVVSGFVSLFLLVWCLALFYNGFKVATNGKGQKFVTFFILGLLLTLGLTILIPIV